MDADAYMLAVVPVRVAEELDILQYESKEYPAKDEWVAVEYGWQPTTSASKDLADTIGVDLYDQPGRRIWKPYYKTVPQDEELREIQRITNTLIERGYFVCLMPNH